MLSYRWSVALNRDWITSIAPLDQNACRLFVGGRGGGLWALDQHGNILGSTQLDSWVGALAVLRNIDDQDLLVAGTKRGAIELIVIEDRHASRIDFEHISTFHARNTVRSIASHESEFGTLVAIGSEDRSVYFFRAEDLGTKQLPEIVQQVTVNGWIRCVEFCFPFWGEGGTPVIAAGCGDKSIHFIEPASARIVGCVECESKVHTLLSTRDGAKLYVTSDSRKLFEITYSRRGRSAKISHSLDLPFRATRIAFVDAAERLLLICSEAGKMVLYDTSSSSLTEQDGSQRPILSMLALPHRPGGGLLMGHDNGWLVFNAFTSKPAARHGSYEQTAPMAQRLPIVDDPEDFAHGLMRGFTLEGVRIGIGRFLEVVKTSEPPSTLFAFASTDEGDLTAFSQGADLALTQIWTLKPKARTRLWSVAATYATSQTIRLHAGTSAKSVILIDWLIDEQRPRVVGEVSCPDWPREVRSTSSQIPGHARVLAGCESGDVLEIEDDVVLGTRVTGGGIIRSLCAIDATTIVVGTDDRAFALFSDGSESWRIECEDRIREVVAFGDLIVAVSEDHYVYAVTLKGMLRWRFRLPHRVLCGVDISSAVGHRAIAVGCGDGQVYVLSVDGTALEGYEFPDRIRDVVLGIDGSLLVTCEDGFLYPVLLGAGSRIVEEDCEIAAQRLVHQLRLRIGENGFAAVETMDLESLLLILEYYEVWRAPVDDDVVLACIDRSLYHLGPELNISLPYRLARVVVELALATDQLAAYRIRLKRLMDLSSEGSCYPAHAVVRAIADPHDHSPARISLFDTVIGGIHAMDEWLREEAVRALDRQGFLSLSENGFCSFLVTTRMPLSRMFRLMADFERFVRLGRSVFAGESTEPSLLDLWQLATRRTTRAMQRVRHFWGSVEHLDLLSDRVSTRMAIASSVLHSPDPQPARVESLLRRWRDSIGENPLTNCLRLALDHCRGLGLDPYTNPGLLAEFVSQQVQRSDPLVDSDQCIGLLVLLAALAALDLQ